MIITVAHGKGGVGKTTSAFNLAFEIAPDKVFDQDAHKGISLLAALRDTPLPFPVLSFDKVAEMVAALQEAHNNDQTVLVDCGGFDSDITRAAIALSDVVIVPAADTPTERAGLLTFDGILDQISNDLNIDITAHLLICRTHHAKKNFPKLDDVLQNTKHLTRLNTVLASRPDHYEPHEFGHGVTEKLSTRYTAAGKEITALAAEIKQIAGIK